MDPVRAALPEDVEQADRAAQVLLQWGSEDPETTALLSKICSTLARSRPDVITKTRLDWVLKADDIVLSWLRDTIVDEGFGGFPTYAQWFAELVRARQDGSAPCVAAQHLRDHALLKRGRSWARFYLSTLQHIGREAPLSTELMAWPSLEKEAAREVPRQYSRMLVDGYVEQGRGLRALVPERRDLPLPPKASRSRIIRLDLTKELEKYIEYTSTLISILNRTYFEKPRTNKPAPKRTPESDFVVLQVKDFRASIGKILDEVEGGKPHLIRAHGKALAVLRAAPEGDADAGVAGVGRAEFAINPGRFLRRARDGEIIDVRAVTSPSGVRLTRPPEPLLHEPTEDERLAAKRDTMRELRERDRTPQQGERALSRAAWRQKRAEEARKLEAVDGMTVEEIRAARKLWEKRRSR